MSDADTIREAIEDGRGEMSSGQADRALAALARLVAVRHAADWLVANRGHRGEQQAWKLLADALAKEGKE